MENFKKKKSKFYILYRIEILIACLGIVAIIILLSNLDTGRYINGHIFKAIIITEAILVCLTGPAFFSLWMFPFDYSILGSYERTPFPTDEEPIDVSNAAISTNIPITLKVYPSGLGVDIFIAGKVFIPKEKIMSIEPLKDVISALYISDVYSLIHKSPEIGYLTMHDIDEGFLEAMKDIKSKKTDSIKTKRLKRV